MPKPKAAELDENADAAEEGIEGKADEAEASLRAIDD